MKLCKKCDTIKELRQFYKKDCGSPSCYCQDCTRAITRARAQRLRDPNKVRKPPHDPATPKMCANCKVVKGPSEYYLIKGRLHSYCKKCTCHKQANEWSRATV